MNQQPTSGASVDWWPTFHHDLTHSGFSTSSGPDTNDIAWAYPTGGSVRSSPAVVDGLVFVGSDNSKVYCLNSTTGDLVWYYQTGGWGVRSSPSVVNGMVYVGSGDHNLYCLDATTGVLNWSYHTGASIQSSPAVSKGLVYVGSHDGYTYCLNASTGHLVWRQITGAMFVLSSPSVVNDRVYIGGGNDSYCLDATTGQIIWRFTTEGLVLSSPSIAYGNVYIGSDGNGSNVHGNFYCLDASTGELVWSFYPYSRPTAGCAAVLNGRVYIACGPCVHCVNAYTGQELWRSAARGGPASAPAIAEDKIYVGGSAISCLNVSTGKTIWSSDETHHTESSPAVVNDRVYVGSTDGNVLCFAYTPRHDLRIYSVDSTKTVVEEGRTIEIAAVVRNDGDYYEASNVTLLVNDTIHDVEALGLQSGNATTVVFTWNTTGFAKARYIVSACVTPVPGETNTTDNSLTYGTVTVTIRGDVDGDFNVTILDVVRITSAYGSGTGDPQFRSDSDLNEDGEITILDVVICTSHYGQKWP